MFFLAYVALMNLFNPKSGLLALIQVRTYFWPSDTECKESRDSSRKKTSFEAVQDWYHSFVKPSCQVLFLQNM
jgi:hypothetical protein